MKRILVTGANGQLGKCIQKIAKDYKDLEFLFFDSGELNITNDDQIQAVFSKNEYQYCINCAAYTNVEQAEKTPEIAFAVNADGVAFIAEACKENNAMLIHISTDYVFDGEKEEPYNTTDIPNPINEYGKSKLKGEEYIQEIMDVYFIVRTSWLYSEFGNNFYKTILKKAKETLYVTDEQTGCPTDANNLAKFIVNNLILDEKPAYGIYHFTDDIPMTWYDFAKEILKKNKLDTTSRVVKDNNYRSFVKRPKYSVLGKKL